MPRDISVFYFHNGSGGGVFSVIRNLAKYANNNTFKNHIVYCINNNEQHEFEVPFVENVAASYLFHYSPKWNFYYTCKQLAKLLPNNEAVVIASDWLELGMVSHLGLCNPVLQILHGDYEYYYNLSQRHSNSIDEFITVSKAIKDKLQGRLPQRHEAIHYLPFPVPDVAVKDYKNISATLQIIFVGRLTRDKGYHLLPLIDQQLQSKNVRVEWNIVGGNKDDEVEWMLDACVKYHGLMPNEEVIRLMLNMDCLVLPSIAEGMPVTLIEAMKVGLTCIVNDLPGGIQELIENGQNGFKVEKNAISIYADIIDHLHKNRSVLEVIGKKATASANEVFNPNKNTLRYEELITECFKNRNKHKQARKVYGSRLDERWIPNFITKTLRNLTKSSF